MVGPLSVGLAVLFAFAAATLYASRAVDLRDRELRHSLSVLVERACNRDLETFSQSRLDFCATLDDRLVASADPRREFAEQQVLARRLFPEGRLGLLSDDGLALAGDPVGVAPRAELLPGRDTLPQPAIRLEPAAGERDASVVIEAPLRHRDGAMRIVWAIPLAEALGTVLTDERASGLRLRVVPEDGGSAAIFPRGEPPYEDEEPGEQPFRFPAGAPDSPSFLLHLAPKDPLLARAGGTRSLVLTFGLVLAVGGAVATTLTLGSLASYRHASRIDPLTGVRNRLEFGDLLARERLRAARYERPLSLAVLDLDHFKRVNDTLGHGTGDELLRVAAHEIERAVRSTDSVFRYGGEEFAILLPETDGASALAVIDRVRERIAAIRFEGAARVGPITVSAGVATMTEDEPERDFLARADAALYRAKELGRDRVLPASPDPSPSPPMKAIPPIVTH